VARLNFSHGSPGELLKRINIIKKLNAQYGRNIKMLGDLQGPRIRTGPVASGGTIALKRNAMLRVTNRKTKGTGQKISFDYKGPLSGIKNGSCIYIDDGNIILQVVGHSGNSLKTKVVIGGMLKGNKGVNIPEARLQFGGLSARDKEDIRFCAKHGVDYVAQSFVRTKSDILAVRRQLRKYPGVKVIAKIESREGIKNIDSIIKASDGIMIARGDMGVCVPIYEIPVIQKVIIRKCNRAKKFVITATQMLESMTEHIRPTRAEVADVANAVIDGTDFVMLSSESAAGRHPVESVSMMRSIIKFTGGYISKYDLSPKKRVRKGAVVCAEPVLEKDDTL
jgi:pyruvate kinase